MKFNATKFILTRFLIFLNMRILYRLKNSGDPLGPEKDKKYFN